MAPAELWKMWRSPAGERVRNFAIITTRAKSCAAPRDRMPVVLSPQSWPARLDEELAKPARLKALRAPYPSEEMTCWQVSLWVGNIKNNDPSLIEPIAVGYDRPPQSQVLLDNIQLKRALAPPMARCR